jgi:hypothetical protein
MVIPMVSTSRALRSVRVCSSVLIAVAQMVLVGCGPSCGPSYPSGTRLKVTVLGAFEGCNITFEGGQVYDLVAGPPRATDAGDGASCEANFPQSLPVFKTSDYSVGHCRPGPGSMTIDCEVGLPTCPRVAASRLTAHYGALPEDRGDSVTTELRLSYTSEETCIQSCSARIPVTIRW